MPPADPTTKKPLDIVVKFALWVFVGSFAMIWGGMYLSRPDRSIPPYTVGSQSGYFVATYVPRDTQNDQIEQLVLRKSPQECGRFRPQEILPHPRR